MDEFDSRMLDLGSLRRNVGLVLPNDEIFEGTIWDNIVMGRGGITPQDVMEAVAITRLDDVFFGSHRITNDRAQSWQESLNGTNPSPDDSPRDSPQAPLS